MLLRRLSGEHKRTVAHWAMELVVVIAGVLIALWVQEWAERRRAAADMAAAEQAIHAEVQETLEELIWRQAISQCHLDRAKQLRSMLLAGGTHWPGLTGSPLTSDTFKEGTGIETVVPSVYQRPFELLPTAAWESALTTGALAPMDPKRFAKLVEINSQIQFLKRSRDKEDHGAAILTALAFPQELTPDTRTRMLSALYEIDTTRFMFNYVGASALADLMRQVGWNDKAEIDRYIAEDEASTRKRAIKFRPCVHRQRNPFDAN